MKNWLCIFLLLLAGNAGATTYYISSAGDNSDGLTWAKAWTHADSLNANMSGGDTALIGNVASYGMKFVPPNGGTFSDRTVIACSTFTTDTSFMYPIISSGELVTSWTDTTIGGQAMNKATWDGLASDCFGDNDNAYTMTQNDSLMIPRETKAAIDQAGMFYHDDANTTVYAWLYGSADPDIETMRITCRPTIHFTDTSNHILFYGLDVQLGKQGVVVYSAGADSVYFEHCNFFGSGQSSGENPAVIMSRNFHSGGEWGEWNNYAACSISSSYAVTGDPPYWSSISDLHRGAGAILYTQRYMVFDSCVFFDLPGPGVYWKMGVTVTGDNRAVGNVVKNSHFWGNSGRGQADAFSQGVVIGSMPYKDSVYDNILENIVESGVLVGNTIGAGNNEGHHMILNNTFYDCGMFVHFWKPNIDTDSTCFVKYNVGYARWEDAPTLDCLGSLTFCSGLANMEDEFSIDSNIWYSPSDTFLTECNTGTGGWTRWTATCGFDANSSNADPVVADSGAGDFTRSGASDEMNLTFGGKTHTIFGGVQNAAAADTVRASMTGSTQLSGSAKLGDD